MLIDEPSSFTGRLHSGMLGGLLYCHIEAAPHVFIDDRPPPPATPRHMVVLQLSGVSTFLAEHRRVRLRPGDVLLLNNVGPLRVDHETRIEQIVLLEPLDSVEARRFGLRGMHCGGSDRQERMFVRWIREACLDVDFDPREVSHDIANLLTRLVVQVLVAGGRYAALPQPVLTRECIEDYIEERLTETDLDPACIAAAFGCSVRTLHRAFASAGKDSLERHLWRRRIEACAQALRDNGTPSTTLTELALEYGFKSPAHFSTLFRELLGLKPSAYRRLHLGR